MKELVIEAKKSNLDAVLSFIDEQLGEAECSKKTRMTIDVAVEELFVNISSYAYDPKIGTAVVQVSVHNEPLSVEITFIDNGKPYDPLAKPDPDVTLDAEHIALIPETVYARVDEGHHLRAAVLDVDTSACGYPVLVYGEIYYNALAVRVLRRLLDSLNEGLSVLLRNREVQEHELSLHLRQIILVEHVGELGRRRNRPAEEIVDGGVVIICELAEHIYRRSNIIFFSLIFLI